MDSHQQVTDADGLQTGNRHGCMSIGKGHECRKVRNMNAH